MGIHSADLFFAISETAIKLDWERSQVVSSLIEATRASIKRKHGDRLNLEVSFDEECCETEAFIFKEVVPDESQLTDKDLQITLLSARRQDPESIIGDELGLRINTENLDFLATRPGTLASLCKRYGKSEASGVRSEAKKARSEDKKVRGKAKKAKSGEKGEALGVRSEELLPLTPNSSPLTVMEAPSEPQPDPPSCPLPIHPFTDSPIHRLLVGGSPAIEHLRSQITKAAPTNATVLITGENGTGKEVVAQLLHELSLRSEHPIIDVNCAAIPEELIESELFGNEKGAYTGATSRREGKFQAAQGGTLFLDEIGDLNLKAQAKILRVIQERKFERVGGNAPIKADVRIIAATNKDLPEEIASGRFRQDLYYRLNVISIHVPPLRDRIEDVPQLVQHFVAQLCETSPVALHDDPFHAPQNHSWPGNIRELRNWVERTLIMGAQEEVKIPETVQDNTPVLPEPSKVVQIEDARERIKPSLKVVEPVPRTEDDYKRNRLIKALNANGWHRRETAKALGISPETLRYHMRKFELVRAKKKWWAAESGCAQEASPQVSSFEFPVSNSEAP